MGTSEPYDCNAGYSNWGAGWSPNKKEWCCANKKMGCAETTSEPYDCDAGYSNWLAGLPTRRSGAAPTRRWGAPRGTERPTARGLYSESSRNAAALSVTADTEPDAKLFQLIVCCHGDDSSTRAR